MQNLLYPQLFAPMPIINKETGATDAYVVAKCYLLAEIKTYFPNGSNKTKYKVVFQWSLDKDHVVPEFETSGSCSNSFIVPAISHTYEQCQTKVNELNAKLLAERVQPLPVPEATIEYSRLRDLQLNYAKIAKTKITSSEPNNI